MADNSQKPDQGTHYHQFDVLAMHFYEAKMLTPNNIFKKEYRLARFLRSLHTEGA